MKLVRVSRLAIAFVCSALTAGLPGIATLSAQDTPGEQQTSIEVEAIDQIAAEAVGAHHTHIHRSRAGAKDHFAPHGNFEEPSEAQLSVPGLARGQQEQGFATASVPSVPTPGFYPADLSNPTHGKVLAAAQSNNLYVNCAASCWGTPATFLTHLGGSNFIHVADQYVSSTGNNRYTVGPSASLKFRGGKLTDLDILQIVHSGARLHGSGYDHVYHVFLPKGTDVCFSGTTTCYSPDNLATFAFCAYHGSVDFQDIGHVLYTVEPFQNVRGCAVAQPSPNGALVDSTASTLSHELIEAITDPDGTAWYARATLIEYGAEIADICQTPTGQFGVVALSGKSYKVQPEYSNKYHACADAP
jgi:hypothetical protein